VTVAFFPTYYYAGALCMQLALFAATVTEQFFDLLARSKTLVADNTKRETFNYKETDFAFRLPHFSAFINIEPESTINSKQLKIRWTFPLGFF
jgi:hypothetical protein